MADHSNRRNDVFARNLRRAQAEAEFTNLELARRLDISESLLGKWRRGDGRPELGNAVRLADALGRPVEWFLEHHDEEPVAA